MKKIGMILAASAIAISASAAPATGLRNPAPKKQNAAPAATLQESDLKGKTVRAIRKADGDNTTLAGSWSFYVGDLYFDDSLGMINVDYTATLDGDEITFTDPKGNYEDFFGTYDADTYTISFEKNYVGTKDGYYVYQEPYLYNDATGEIDDVDALIGEYNPNLGLMTFGALVDGTMRYGDVGLAWEAFKGSNNAGYFDIFDFVSATYNDAVLPGDSGEWKDLGDAIFMDGWVLPGLDIDQVANQYAVPLQQSAENENRYRLVNPYKTGPAAQYNSSTADGYIVFDVSDPKHVVFETSDAGFSNPQMGVTTLYCYNQLGMLMANYPQYTAQEIVSLQEGYTPWTTFEDGCVKLTSIRSKNGNLVYDANFGYQLAPLGGYSWSDENKQPINMDARILFPGADGVESVGVDENAPAEYFNLQGIRVVNPQPGQLLIKRQGSLVSKQLIR